MSSSRIHSCYSMRELHAAAVRELKLRQRVYPNRVLTKRMSQQQADAEIGKMRAIADYFAELAERERLL